ncbi:MAG: crossover junction endodeoxyribonuclease RuvC [Minisyncoccia bacterium]
MKVIAIDPGYGRVGIAVLEKESNTEHVLFSECFSTEKSDDLNTRIFQVGNRINDLILEYKPKYMSIEALFFSKNTQTAMSVAEARGVIIYQALRNNIPVHEYTPNQIKVAVAGHGGANKRDIFYMVERLVKIDDRKRIDDELDAIAIGLTFLASYREY